MKSPLITDAMLLGACPEQRDIFRKEWPKGAAVTVRNGLRAVKLGLNISWLARYLQYDLWVEYQRQLAQQWAEYQRQIVFILVPLLRKQLANRGKRKS